MATHFNQYAEKGNRFLKEIARELGDEKDQNKAARVLRGVLHTLRDLLTLEESLQFIAQLPMAIKSVYVDGWKLKEGNPGRIKHINDFIHKVKEADVTDRDFFDKAGAQHAVRSVFKVLNQYISQGEMEDIMAVLPLQIKRYIHGIVEGRGNYMWGKNYV